MEWWNKIVHIASLIFAIPSDDPFQRNPGNPAVIREIFLVFFRPE